MAARITSRRALDCVPAPLNSSDFFGVSPDARQVAIEFAKSRRIWRLIFKLRDLQGQW
jgi:hypothetical protein